MKVTVHIGFEQGDLARLDAWAKAHRQTRGAAVMSLLEMAEKPLMVVHTPATQMAEDALNAMVSPTELATITGESGKAPSVRLALGKAVLKQAQKYTGVSPVIEGYDDDLLKVDDPEAKEGLDRFYEKKVSGAPVQSQLKADGGWEEPP